mmetsp:Transcript_26959/g.31060  ORF Transcript_26959/g.31060 Transcript_26959/m.31060 type:complete len:81 (+) Transcript_26959:181-423(+)
MRYGAFYIISHFLKLGSLPFKNVLLSADDLSNDCILVENHTQHPKRTLSAKPTSTKHDNQPPTLREKKITKRCFSEDSRI